ncbi:MAG: hypothetical protein AAFV86_04360 [Pseudomonadota bacterium]
MSDQGNTDGSVTFGEVSLGDDNVVTLYGQIVTGVTFEANGLSAKVRKTFDDAGQPPVVARIRGMRHQDESLELAAPITMLLPKTEVRMSPELRKAVFGKAEIGSFLVWQIDLDAATMAIEVERATVAEALGGTDGDEDADSGAAEGFTLRGPDGRLYFIDGNLDGYEVVDEAQRSALQLASGVDRDELRVREVFGASMAGGIETRARMQSRARLTGRARMQSRARMMGRARLLARARLTAATAKMRREVHHTHGDED